jgi:ABC-type transport system substrate-binding protein
MRRDSVFVESLARAWIEPEIRYVDWAELDRRLTELDADSFFIIWIADLPDPDSFLYTLFSGEGLYNMFAYADPVVDSLLAAGQKDRDMGQRQRLYRQAEQRILEDAPCVPLFNFMVTFAFQPEVRGVEMTPFGLSGIPMHRIWLDREPATEVRHAGL